MIDTDKYETKKKRNWRLKVTQPDIGNSAEAFNGYDTDMIPQGYEDIIAVDSLGRERYTVAQMVDTGFEDAQLIADAPLLLAEVKRLYELHALVGVSIPWKVDYGDGGGYETFVADAVVWNYDDSGEWVLVNYNESRWMTLETAKNEDSI